MLDDMTSAKWNALSASEKSAQVDKSKLHPKLIGLEGYRVRVTPKRGDGCKSTFRVGKTTGWQPVHLAVRANAYGSSDIIHHTEYFETVTILK